jgi:cytochrome P450
MSQPSVFLPSKGQANRDPYALPLDRIDVSDSELFETDSHWGYFERLRKEDPVHYCAQSDFGPFWSVTRYADVVAVEKDAETYSSMPSIVIGDPDPDFPLRAGFITLDGDPHDAHRKVVQPVASPRNLAVLEPLIRRRAAEILEGLPVGETFDWVDRVSIELTPGMLATLLDIQEAERRKLTYWSDMATASPSLVGSDLADEETRRAALRECLAEFTELWKQRQGRPPGERVDFITALANADATRTLEPLDYLGTLVLLIVGGNDTTRNSISGGIVALNENPDEYQKLRDHPELIPNMVSEIIRWLWFDYGIRTS